MKILTSHISESLTSKKVDVKKLNTDSSKFYKKYVKENDELLKRLV